MRSKARPSIVESMPVFRCEVRAFVFVATWCVSFVAGCRGQAEPDCLFEGDPTLTLTPRKGQGTLDGEVTDLPAFAAPQGVPASEVDFLLTGVDPEDITTIRVTVVADSLGIISDTTYIPQSIGYQCLEEGGLFVKSLPVAYVSPIAVVDDLTDLTGTLAVDISGATPLNVSYPVELRITSY